MLAFPHRRAIHRSVLVTLAAWVLALMAGYANACFPHEREPSHPSQVQAADPDAHEATCNDAWDGAAMTVTKQASHDSSYLDAVLLLASTGGPKPVAVAAVEEAVDVGLHAHGPPGAIRFLRLRL